MIKKSVFLAFIIMFLSVISCRNQSTSARQPILIPQDSGKITDSANGPDLVFAQDTVDFGKVKEGAILTHSFNMRNRGTQPVIISRVQTSCGCTSAYWPKQAIGMKQIDSIQVEFHTQGNSGEQNKKILIFSNSVNKILVLTVHAFIQL